MVKYRVGKIIVFALCLTLLFPLSACSYRNYERFFYNVFEITCTATDKFDSSGTAFILADGRIITNAHIISYKNDGILTLYETITAKQYNTNKQYTLTCVKIDYEKDIAILSNAELAQSTIGLRMYNTQNAYIGQELITIGNLNNYGLCCNKGMLSAQLKPINNNGVVNNYFQTNIEISKGSSGGPVLTLNGEVLGIMTFKVRDSNYEYVDGMSFFIPIENINF